ncbi:MAG: hypothetical protein WCQ20_10565 [Synechococcaceae cyanobacterium ELA739]
MPASPSSQPRRSTGRHRQTSPGASKGGPVGRAARQERPEATTGRAPSEAKPRNATMAVFAADGELLTLSNERRELLCSVIGLSVKFGLVAVAAVSLFRLSTAYQQRMDRQGEISAVLELETAKLAKSRERFDELFTVSGEQQLIREQSQWIAPNRLRVVWQQSPAFPTVETASARPSKPLTRP